MKFIIVIFDTDKQQFQLRRCVMNNKELLNELKKLATKSNIKIINNNHTIFDSLVIITMSTISMGNENGLVIDLYRQYKSLSNMCYNYLDEEDELDNYVELTSIFELCKHIIDMLDIKKIIINEPKGYNFRRNIY